ncbi:hypothetical protein PMIN02_002688 [Paraphaeosphaeria minitans]|uniref:Uncharacterized protein n=1 Tax=Paraphaeosphaeria minitans TaxID=565426 RepID=A0A9P6GEF2_9PLEO|nr:hypothetical protein PMIN01_08039 [Paraphaeosphaeria minitans]
MARYTGQVILRQLTTTRFTIQQIAHYVNPLQRYSAARDKWGVGELNQLFTLSIPAMESAIGRYSNVEARQQNQANVAASATYFKDRILFVHRVIFSRTPIYRAKSWHPKGHLLEKYLSELVDEVPFKKKEGLTGSTIQLKCSSFVIEETIKCGQDAIYDSSKEELMEIVDLCLKNHVEAEKCGKLVVKFKIEAVREGIDEDHEDSEMY